jgi:flagellar hook-associated protein FlgK
MKEEKKIISTEKLILKTLAHLAREIKDIEKELSEMRNDKVHFIKAQTTSWNALIKELEEAEKDI